MGIIKQFKQFLTGEQIFPVTKTNAVYDDTIGRLDKFIKNVPIDAEVAEMGDGLIRSFKNPITGKYIFPVTRVNSIYDDNGVRLDKYLEEIKGNSSNNLLINSNFANPVNQRGYVSGTSITSFGFVLDRWLLQYSGKATSTSLTINKGYVTINGLVGTKYNDLFQKIEFAEQYASKTVTMSAKYKCTKNSKAMLYAYNGGATTNINSYPKKDLICDGEWHTATLTFTVEQDVKFLTASISPGKFEWDGSVHKWEELSMNTQLDVEWMKLEIGELATPYVPRLYAEELYLCHRYYYKSAVSSIYKTANNHLFSTLQFPVEMREVPTLQVYPLDGADGVIVGNVSGWDGIKRVNVACNTDIITNNNFRIMTNENSSYTNYDFYYVADAEL